MTSRRCLRWVLRSRAGSSGALHVTLSWSQLCYSICFALTNELKSGFVAREQLSCAAFVESFALCRIVSAGVQDHGPLAEADVARAMFEVLQTIDSCHANNFYHGDVKPANFMLKDQPKIRAHGPTFEK